MKSDDVPWLSAGKGGTYIDVIVTPGASEDSIKGIDQWRKLLEISVKERAEGGKANNAVIGLISDILHVPSSSVSIASGQRARRKKIFVVDMDVKRAIGIISRCLES